MKKQDDQDFTKHLGRTQPSHKERLIQECQKRKVSIYVDDAAETSSGAYAVLRPVVSEAELERRLNASRAVGLAQRANVIAVTAMLVSVIALVKAFL